MHFYPYVDCGISGFYWYSVSIFFIECELKSDIFILKLNSK